MQENREKGRDKGKGEERRGEKRWGGKKEQRPIHMVNEAGSSCYSHIHHLGSKTFIFAVDCGRVPLRED